MRSRLALASGDSSSALALAMRALKSARGERGEDRIADRYSLAAAYRLIGDIRQRGGDASGAKAVWQTAVDQLPGEVRERPLEISERAEILRRLGRQGEYRPLINQLTAMGYRGTT
jgi:hypothetical protein